MRPLPPTSKQISNQDTMKKSLNLVLIIFACVSLNIDFMFLITMESMQFDKNAELSIEFYEKQLIWPVISDKNIETTK